MELGGKGMGLGGTCVPKYSPLTSFGGDIFAHDNPDYVCIFDEFCTGRFGANDCITMDKRATL